MISLAFIEYENEKILEEVLLHPARIVSAIAHKHTIITTLIVFITGLLKFELVKFIIAQKYEFFNYHYFLSTY